MPRELIDTGTDKRFVRRSKSGQFKDVVDVGKSLAQDRKRKAKRTVKAGEGDRGDQKPRKAAPARSRAKASVKAKPAARSKATTARQRSKPKAAARRSGSGTAGRGR